MAEEQEAAGSGRGGGAARGRRAMRGASDGSHASSVPLTRLLCLPAVRLTWQVVEMGVHMVLLCLALMLRRDPDDLNDYSNPVDYARGVAETLAVLHTVWINTNEARSIYRIGWSRSVGAVRLRVP